MKRLALIAPALLASSCLAQWNSLRNDYRIQGSNGFEYLCQEAGETRQWPRMDLEIWNIDYFVGHTSFAYSVGHQMAPSAASEWQGHGDQSAICRWTASADGTYTIRSRFYRTDPDGGYPLWASLTTPSEQFGPYFLQLNSEPQAVVVSTTSTLTAGQFVDLRVDPDVTSGVTTTMNFELAIFGPCQADLTGDGLVDDADFVNFCWHYDRFESVGADFNDDGFTEDADFVQFCSAYDALLCE